MKTLNEKLEKTNGVKVSEKLKRVIIKEIRKGFNKGFEAGFMLGDKTLFTPMFEGREKNMKGQWKLYKKINSIK